MLPIRTGLVQNLLWLLLVSVVIASTPAAAEPSCSPYQVHWRFRSTSPLVANIAVGGQGRVFAASQEGYLHALTSDGRFLWSYTTHGALDVGLAADEDDRVYAVSTHRILYALKPNGWAHWVQHLPVAVDRAPALSSQHAIHLIDESTLYAVSSRAGLLWGVPLGAPPSGDLFEHPEGSVWLMTEEGTLHVVRTPYHHERASLFSRDGQLIGVEQEKIVASSQGELVVFERAGEDEWKTSWSTSGVIAAALTHAGEVGVVRSASVEWHALADGTLAAEVPSSARLSAKPAFDATRAYLPLRDGRLLLVSRTGETSSCKIAGSALFEPILDEERGQVIVAAGSGVVAAVRVPSVTP